MRALNAKWNGNSRSFTPPIRCIFLRPICYTCIYEVFLSLRSITIPLSFTFFECNRDWVSSYSNWIKIHLIKIFVMDSHVLLQSFSILTSIVPAQKLWIQNHSLSIRFYLWFFSSHNFILCRLTLMRSFLMSSLFVSIYISFQSLFFLSAFLFWFAIQRWLSWIVVFSVFLLCIPFLRRRIKSVCVFDAVCYSIVQKPYRQAIWVFQFSWTRYFDVLTHTRTLSEVFVAWSSDRVGIIQLCRLCFVKI